MDGRLCKDRRVQFTVHEFSWGVSFYRYREDYCSPLPSEVPRMPSLELKFVMMNEARQVKKGKAVRASKSAGFQRIDWWLPPLEQHSLQVLLIVGANKRYREFCFTRYTWNRKKRHSNSTPGTCCSSVSKVMRSEGAGRVPAVGLRYTFEAPGGRAELLLGVEVLSWQFSVLLRWVLLLLPLVFPRGR